MVWRARGASGACQNEREFYVLMIGFFSFTFDGVGCKYHEAKLIRFIFVAFDAKLDYHLDEILKRSENSKKTLLSRNPISTHSA